MRILILVFSLTSAFFDVIDENCDERFSAILATENVFFGTFEIFEKFESANICSVDFQGSVEKIRYGFLIIIKH